ncbi:hypothetical protein BH09ACT7_BH09ACT7_28950 [soil metagenome]
MSGREAAASRLTTYRLIQGFRGSIDDGPTTAAAEQGA